MGQVPLWTYQDLLDHLIDFLGGNPSGEANRDARRAIQSAIRVFANAHRWSFFYQRGRVVTNAMFGTNPTPSPPPNAPTVTYTAATQQLVVAGAAWPAWIGQGTILLSAIEYPVQSVIDSQTVQLPANNSPAADLPAGTLFMAYQDTYALPSDFVSTGEVINSTYVMGLEYVHPSAWLSKHRLIYTPATPYRYTITGHPNYFGTMAVRFFPAPDTVYQMDYLYQRRPRPLVLDTYLAGTASVTANNQIISGTGTTWTSRMIGSVIRFSSDGVSYPTGVVGANPYLYERVVADVINGTSLTLDATIPESLTAVKHLVSDPVDVEDGAMLTALLRCCEWQIARSRNMRDRQEIEQEYNRALTRAQETDSRSFQRRAAGEIGQERLRLAYMPRGADIL